MVNWKISKISGFIGDQMYRVTVELEIAKQSRIELTNDRNTIYSKCLLSVISVKHWKESSKFRYYRNYVCL